MSKTFSSKTKLSTCGYADCNAPGSEKAGGGGGAAWMQLRSLHAALPLSQKKFSFNLLYFTFWFIIILLRKHESIVESEMSSLEQI